MAATFEDMVLQLKEIGFFNFFLTYLLIFAVYYGTILRSKFFGEQTSTIAAIVSIVAAFYTMYYALSNNLAELLGSFLPRLGVAMFAIVTVYLVSSLASGGDV